MKKTAAAAVLAAALAGCTSAAGHAHAGNAGSAHPASHASRTAATAGSVAACEAYAAQVAAEDRADEQRDMPAIQGDPAPAPCAGLNIPQRSAITWNALEPDAPVAVPSGGA
jgi:hypothetical protein